MRTEPPIAYAPAYWDPETRLLEYKYNGHTLVSMQIPGNDEVRYRMASDGQLQSSPFVQQIYVVVYAESVKTQVTFTMSEDAVAMQPKRSGSEQAVLGQVGRPVIDGVNGMYDIFDDLLISWHGRPWHWVGDRLTTNADGSVSGTIEIELGRKPWIINVLPQYYRKHLGYEYHKPWEFRPNTKAVAGWCSWEAYRREVTEENIVGASKFVAENFKDYGLEYVQLDDGFQRVPVAVSPDQTLTEAWLNPIKEKFPSGLNGLCKTIKDLGLLPGVWLSTDTWSKKANVDPPEFLLRGADGKPLEPCWMSAAVDCSPAMLADHLLPLYEAWREAGFEYVKTDQLRHLLYDALHEMVRQGLMTNDEVEHRFRSYMETARKGLGPDVYYLASWGVLPQVVGIADACRIATDANPQWPKVRMQIVESARWWHMHRILFTNDPDHICARTKPEWTRSLMSLVSLSGGLLMLSDPIESYDSERVRIIQRCLPPLATTTGETGPVDLHYPAYAWTKVHGAAFKGAIETTWDEVGEEEAYVVAGDDDRTNDDHPLASLWAFHLATDAGQWCVAMRAATLPLHACEVSLSNLGLSSDKTYLAFDFWAEKYLGEVSGSINVPALELGYCQVIGLRERLDRPQLVGSTRHVSMDAVSVKRQEWNDGVLTVELTGVPNTTETYWFHRPDGWTFNAADAEGAEVSGVDASGRAIAVLVTFTNGHALLRLRWNAA